MLTLLDTDAFEAGWSYGHGAKMDELVAERRALETALRSLVDAVRDYVETGQPHLAKHVARTRLDMALAAAEMELNG